MLEFKIPDLRRRLDPSDFTSAPDMVKYVGHHLSKKMAPNLKINLR